MSNFNDKHLLWWVFAWIDDAGIGSGGHNEDWLGQIDKTTMDYFVKHSDIPETDKEKYKTWIWNAFVEKRKIFQERRNHEKGNLDA